MSNTEHVNRSLPTYDDKIPNPFERRQFAFEILPDERDSMSRARHHSWIMPTLKSRLQQLITTRLWESIVFILSIWSFILLIIGEQLSAMHIMFELTHELTLGRLCISYRTI
jgi:hypothetical protein